MKGLMYNFKMWRVLLTKLLKAKNLMVKYNDDWPEPVIEHPNQVKVETLLGGICGSDLHEMTTEVTYYVTILASPRNPFPNGHEVVARVTEVGEQVKGLALGDRVVYYPVSNCAMYGFEPCPSCQRGEYQACFCLTGRGDGTPLEEKYGGRGKFGGYGGGGFSERFVGFEQQFFKVPTEVPDEVAVLAEPFTIGLHAVTRNLPKENDQVLVVGAGTIGLMIIAALKTLGCKNKITVLARYPFQSEAATKIGADKVIMERDQILLYEKVVEMMGGTLFKPTLSKPVNYGTEGPDIIFDSVATESSLDNDLRLVRHGGKIVVVGQGFSVTKKVDWAIQVYKEVTVAGALMQSMEPVAGEKKHAFQLAMDLMAQNVGVFEGLVTHTFPVEQYKEALEVARAKGPNRATKVVFDFRKKEN